MRRPALLLVVSLALTACASTPVVDSDGVRIAYDVRGAGPPLVLVHGWACAREQFDGVADHLAGRYRVVNVDLPGHGESGAGRERWTIEALGADVAHLVETLDLEGAVVVGHSMGGWVALAAAARAPRRIAGVVGIDTIQDVETDVDPAQIEAMATSLEEDFDGTLAGWLLSAYDGVEHADVRARIVEDTRRADRAAVIGLIRCYADTDFEALADACPVGVRCVNASQPPTDVEGNRRHLPSFDLVVMDGVAHWLHLERPRECADHVAAAVDELRTER